MIGLSASVPRAELAAERALGRLVERAAGEAQRGGADGGAEDIERRHRLREAFAALAEQGVGGEVHRRRSAGSRADAARSPRMRSLMRQARRVGGDDEGGNALARPAPRRCARTGRRNRRCRRSRYRSWRRRRHSRPRSRARWSRSPRRRSPSPARSARTRRSSRPRATAGRYACLLRLAAEQARSCPIPAPASRRRNRRGPNGARASRGSGRASGRRARRGRRHRPPGTQ